jgi:thiopeptide-type bacteriocin biosynthesis protein
MAGRSTPFGLFSGCSVGSVRPDAATELELVPRQQYRTATRLDFDYLFTLTSELRRNRTLQLEMHYGCNSSLHRTGDSWHYVESRPSGSSLSRSHHLVKLTSDDYLDSVLACARPGNSGFAELAAAIRSCEDSESLTAEEIDDYLSELIDSEILVPDILPLLTGKPAFDDLLDHLREMPSASSVYETLAGIRDSLSAFDHRPLDVDPKEYRSIAKELEALPAKVNEAHLLQVDMFKPVQNANLGQAVLDEIYSTLDILGRVTALNEPGDLVQFRNAFTARYEQEWVSLVEALDLEVGIGYGRASTADGSPLLRDLPLAAGQGSNNSNNVGLNEFQVFLLQKVLDCALAGKNELELQLADFPAKKNLDELLPESFVVMASLAASSSEALRKGDFELVYKGGTGPTCSKMLGRFCLVDPELDSLVRAALREEEAQDPEAVYAEIVYLPEGNIGNVLCRPVLRDYEIVHLGRSGAPADRQLPTDDLLLSVRDGKIVLYSKRLRRRVIPRLSNAHGFTRPDLSPLYRFLCELQNQGGMQVPYFSWGGLAKLNALPRVRIGRVVLACARWRISSAESKALCDLERQAAFLKTREMQRKRGLPRWVVLSEGDTSLPVDFDNPLSVDAMLHLLKRTPEATLVEMYPQPDRQGVTGPEGRFEHELIIPLARKRPSPKVDSAVLGKSSNIVQQINSTSGVQRAERLLPPGSDWQFVKIYSGTASLDDLLAGELAPLLSSLAAQGYIAHWFFIRYSDPEPHLRLRFQTFDHAVCPEITRALESLLADGRLWKIQFDTYQREIERYGGLEGTLISEEIFCADSEAVIAILQALEGDDGLDTRWRIALLGIDALFTDCGFDLDERLRLITRLRNSFTKEFHLLSVGKQKLSDRFRKERTQLEAMMRRESGVQNAAYEIALKAFARRSERTQPAIANIRALEQRNALATDFFDIVGSYVHMHVNRIIRSSPRVHELVLYDFLYRLYDGDRARKKRPLPEAVLAAE